MTFEKTSDIIDMSQADAINPPVSETRIRMEPGRFEGESENPEMMRDYSIAQYQ